MPDMKMFLQELHRVEEQIEAINRSKIWLQRAN
jgi:hypothetical protein